ncbi:hypothetical protein GGI42DRAFT_162605 [Trichoderma sp. SZMC 28013]
MSTTHRRQFCEADILSNVVFCSSLTITPHRCQRRIPTRHPTSHHITLWPPTRFAAKSAQLEASRPTTYDRTRAAKAAMSDSSLLIKLCFRGTNHINTISENSTQKLSAGFNSGLSSGSVSSGPGRSSGEVGRARSKTNRRLSHDLICLTATI